MGLFAPTSSVYVASFDPAMEEKIRNIDSGGTTRKVDTPVVKTEVKPIEAQPSEVETDDPDPATFDSDGYRRGVSGGDSSELVNPRTLSINEGDEEQIASLTLRTTDSKQTEIISTYTRFFLQSAVEAEQEKYQLIETFTSFYVFFYGKRPPIYRYAGTLISDPIYRWNNDFKFVYENYFRGTRATEFNSEVILQYDGRIITGFPLNLTMQQDAMNDKGIPFAMDLLVVSHTPIKFSTDIAALIDIKKRELEDMRAKSAVYRKGLTGISSHTARASDLVTNGVIPASSVMQPTDSLSNSPPVTQYYGGKRLPY